MTHTSDRRADFLVDFDHADVAFGEVVVEWHREVGREAQHVVGVGVEAEQQVGGFGAFGSASFAGRDGWRVGVVTGSDDRAVVGVDAVEVTDTELGVPVGFGGAHLLPGVAQQSNHVGGPRLVAGAGGGVEFAEVVGVTQGVVDTGVVAVGDPSVMDEHAG